MTAAMLIGLGAQLIHVGNSARRIDAQARRYVAIVLELRRIAGSEVDGYFGPPAMVPAENKPPAPLSQLEHQATDLLREVEDDRLSVPPDREAHLAARVQQLVRVLELLQARRRPPFAEEARTIYGVDLGTSDDQPRRQILAELASLLPGSGPLPPRVAAYRARFVVLADRRPAILARALAECRRRTLQHWPLPDGERVSVEWTESVPAAWHQYLGGFRSSLRINPQAVAFLGSAIDVACHEAYPGHHAQFIAMEAAAGTKGLPVEDTVMLLRSPDSVLREGAANYGVRLAFPLEERIAFERDVLFPLAGFPPAEADRYARVHRLLGDLELSTVPILRRYEDGTLSPDAAEAALANEAMISSPRALLAFADDLGAYSVGYTIARDRVADQVEARSARTGRDRWSVLHDIVAAVDASALAPVPPIAPPPQGGDRQPARPRRRRRRGDAAGVFGRRRFTPSQGACR